MKKYLISLTLCLMAAVCLICGCGHEDRYAKLSLEVYRIENSESYAVEESNNSLTVEYGGTLDLKAIVGGMKNINNNVDIVVQDPKIAKAVNKTLSGSTTTATLVAGMPGRTIVTVSSSEYSEKEVSFVLYVNNSLEKVDTTIADNETLVYTEDTEINLKDYYTLEGRNPDFEPTANLKFTLNSATANFIDKVALEERGVLKVSGSGFKDISVGGDAGDDIIVKTIGDNGEELNLTYIPALTIRYLEKLDSSDVCILDKNVEGNKIESDRLKLILADDNYYSAEIITDMSVDAPAKSGMNEDIHYKLGLYDSTGIQDNDYFTIRSKGIENKKNVYAIQALTRAGEGSLGVEVVVDKIGNKTVINKEAVTCRFDKKLTVETISMPNGINVNVGGKAFSHNRDPKAAEVVNNISLYDSYEGVERNTLRIRYNSYQEISADNRMIKLSTSSGDISDYVEIIEKGDIRPLQVEGKDADAYFVLDTRLEYTIRAKRVAEITIVIEPIFNNIPAYVFDEDGSYVPNFESVCTGSSISLNVQCTKGVNSLIIYDPSDDSRTIDGTRFSTIQDDLYGINIKFSVNNDAVVSKDEIRFINSTDATDTIIEQDRDGNWLIGDEENGQVLCKIKEDPTGSKNIGYIYVIGKHKGSVKFAIDFGNGYRKDFEVNILEQFNSFSVSTDDNNTDSNITYTEYSGNDVAKISVKKTSAGFNLYFTADPTFGGGELISISSNNVAIVDHYRDAEHSNDVGYMTEVKKAHSVALMTIAVGDVDLTIIVRYKYYDKDEITGLLSVEDREIEKHIIVTVFEPITTVSVIGREQTVYSRESLGYDNFESSMAIVGVNFNGNATINQYLNTNVTYEIISNGSDRRGVEFASERNSYDEDRVVGGNAYLVAHNDTSGSVSATVKITIDEFGSTIVRYATINIVNAKRTQSIKLENAEANEINVEEARKNNDNVDGMYTSRAIALKRGESIKLTSSYLPVDDVTFPGVSYFIRTDDGVYERYNGTSININNEKGTVLSLIDDNKITAGTAAGVVYILIVANDRISQLIDGNTLFITNNRNIIDQDYTILLEIEVTDGTINNPYVINSLRDFEGLFGDKENIEYFVLGRDINVAGIGEQYLSKDFKNVFNGYYKGYIHTIRGFSYTNNAFGYEGETNVFGLFGRVTENAKLLNVKLDVDSVVITTENEDRTYNIGLLAGENNGLIQNCSVNFKNFSVKCDVGVLNVGPVAGLNNSEVYNYARLGVSSEPIQTITPYSLLRSYASYYNNSFMNYVTSGVADNYVDAMLSSAISLNNVVGNMYISGAKQSSNKDFNVGGMVGLNEGNIHGIYSIYEYLENIPSESEQEFEFMPIYESQGVDVSINISAIKNTNIEAHTLENVCYTNIGGAIGKSTGLIEGVSAEGKIGYVSVESDKSKYNIEGNIGGIVGYVDGDENDGTIDKSRATVYIAGSGTVGGAVGLANDATISDVKVEIYDNTLLGMQASLIRANGYVGGIVGNMNGGELRYSFIKSYVSRSFIGVGESNLSTGWYNGDILIYKNSAADQVSVTTNTVTGTVIEYCFGYINVCVMNNTNAVNFRCFVYDTNSTNGYVVVHAINKVNDSFIKNEIFIPNSFIAYKENGALDYTINYSSDGSGYNEKSLSALINDLKSETNWDTVNNISSNSGYPVIKRDDNGNALLTLIPQSLDASGKYVSNKTHVITKTISQYKLDGTPVTPEGAVDEGNIHDLILMYNTSLEENVYSLNEILKISATPAQLRTIRIITHTSNSLASVDTEGKLHVYGTGSFDLDLTALLNSSVKKTVKIDVLPIVNEFYVNIANSTTIESYTYTIRKDTDVQLYTIIKDNSGTVLGGDYIVKYNSNSINSENNIANFATKGKCSITATLYYNYHGILIEQKIFAFTLDVTEGATDIYVSPIESTISPSEEVTVEVVLETDIIDDTYTVTITQDAEAKKIKKKDGSDYGINEIFNCSGSGDTFTIKLKDDDVMKRQILDYSGYTYTFTFTADSSPDHNVYKSMTVTLIPQVLRSIETVGFNYYGIGQDTPGSKDYSTYFTVDEADEMIVGPGEELLFEIDAYPEFADVYEFRVTSDAGDKIRYKQVVRDASQDPDTTDPDYGTLAFKDYTQNYIGGDSVSLDKVSYLDGGALAYDGRVYVSILVDESLKKSTFELTFSAIRNDGSEIEIKKSSMIYVQEVATVSLNAKATYHQGQDNVIVPIYEDKSGNQFIDQIEFSVTSDGTIGASDIVWSYEYKRRGSSIDPGYCEFRYDGNTAFIIMGELAEVGDKITVKASYVINIDGKTYTNSKTKEITVVDYVITSTSINGIDDNNVLSVPVAASSVLSASVEGIGPADRQNEIGNKISRILKSTATGSQSATWKVNVGGVYKSINDSSIRSSLPFEPSITYLGDKLGLKLGVISVMGVANGMTASSIKHEYISYYGSDGKLVVDDPDILVNGAQEHSTEFYLLVYILSDDDNPIPLYSAQDFINMAEASDSNSNAHYILMNDIVLDDYTPISTAISSLDGNNKTITINSFAIDQTATGTINLGLFDTVQEGTMLKNLIVVYPSNKVFATQLTNFDTVNFGGIAGINNGIITNCDVATTFIKKNGNKTGSYTFNLATSTTATVYVGGLVGQNNYIITNSRVGNEEVKIFDVDVLTEIDMPNMYDEFLIKVSGAVNLGGFVGINSDDGIISSSYAKNLQLEAINGFSTNQKVAGFATFNNGSIYGSYSAGWEEEDDIKVESNSTRQSTVGVTNDHVYYNPINDGVNYNRRMGGGIFANYIAGFVYENNYVISDCYSAINLTGCLANTGSDTHAGGFVYHNGKNGSILNSYSNSMVKNNHIHGPFVGINAVTNELYNEGSISKVYYLKEKNQKLYEDLEVAICLDQEAPEDLESLISDIDADIRASLNINNFVVSSNFGGFSFDSTGDNISYSHDMQSGAVWAIRKDSNVGNPYSYQIKNETIQGDYGYPELIAANQAAISVRQLYSVTEDESNGSKYNYTYFTGYSIGSAKNPILIDSAEKFNKLFKNYFESLSQSSIQFTARYTGSIRIVDHLDFSSLSSVDSSIFEYASTNTVTSVLDGNNLTWSNINLSTAENLDSFGMFKSIYKAVVKNIKFTVGEISADNSKAVGTLAGVIADSDIINIEVIPTSQNSRITGRNYVGGVAGAIVSSERRNQNDPNHFISNISANVPVIASYDSTEFNVLKSGDFWNTIIPPAVSGTNPNDKELKLGYMSDKMSYAGGIAGVVDLKQDEVDSTTGATRPSLDNVNVRAVMVGSYDTTSNIVFNAQGVNVGGVFGFVGNQTCVKDASMILPVTNSDKNYLNGILAVGGIAGFNYGKISQSIVSHIDSQQLIIDRALSTYVDGDTTTINLGNTKFFSYGEPIYAGGIAGIDACDTIADSGIIEHSYNRISVSNAKANYVGGIVGLVGSVNFNRVYFTGSLLAKEAMGGAVGITAGSGDKYCFLNGSPLNLNAVVVIPVELPEDFNVIKTNMSDFYSLYCPGDGSLDVHIDADSYYTDYIYKDYKNNSLQDENLRYKLLGESEGVLPVIEDEEASTKLSIRDLFSTQETTKTDSAMTVFNTGVWTAAIWKQPLDRAFPILTYGYLPRYYTIYSVDDYVDSIAMNASSDALYFICKDIDMNLTDKSYIVTNTFRGSIYGVPQVVDTDRTRNPILFNIKVDSDATSNYNALFHYTVNAGIHGVDFVLASFNTSSTTTAFASFIVGNAKSTTFNNINIYSSVGEAVDTDGVSIIDTGIDTSDLLLYTVGIKDNKLDASINVTTKYRGFWSDSNNSKIESNELSYDTYGNYYSDKRKDSTLTYTSELTSISIDTSLFGIIAANSEGCRITGVNLRLGNMDISVRDRGGLDSNLGTFIGNMSGGICQKSTSTINSLTITTNVNGNNSASIGGFVGNLGAELVNCEFNVTNGITITKTLSTMDADMYVGGIAGKITSGRGLNKVSANTNITITDANSSDAIYVGGIVGDMHKGATTIEYIGNININRGNAGSNAFIGGVFGRLSGINVKEVVCIGKINVDSTTSPNIYIAGAFGKVDNYVILEDIYIDQNISINANGQTTTVYSGLLGGNIVGRLELDNIYTFGEIKLYNSASVRAFVAGFVGRLDITEAVNNTSSYVQILATGDVISSSTLYIDKLVNNSDKKNALAGFVNVIRPYGTATTLGNVSFSYENSAKIIVLPTIYYPEFVDNENTQLAQCVNTTGLATGSDMAPYYNEDMYLSKTNDTGTAVSLSTIAEYAAAAINTNNAFMSDATAGVIKKYSAKLTELKKIFATKSSEDGVEGKTDGESKLYPIAYTGGAFADGTYYKLESEFTGTVGSGEADGWTLYGNGFRLGKISGNVGATAYSNMFGAGGTVTKPAAIVGILNRPIDSSTINKSRLVESNNNGLIYGCCISDTMNTQSAFAAVNNGIIYKSMFVGELKNNESGARAPFVATNETTGRIMDCFVNAVLGGDNNRISGFVSINSGVIKYCYTTAKFEQSSGNYYFVESNTGSLKDCYYESGNIGGLIQNSIPGLRGSNLYDTMDEVFKGRLEWRDKNLQDASPSKIEYLMFNDGLRYLNITNLYLGSGNNTNDPAVIGYDAGVYATEWKYTPVTAGAYTYYSKLYTGAGNSSTDAIKIDSAAKLEYYISKIDVYKYYKVIKDIDFSAYDGTNRYRWSSTGSKINGIIFQGNFNGDRNTFKNITVDNGLFVNIDGANTNIYDIKVNHDGADDSKNVVIGSLFGNLNGGLIHDIEISKSVIDGTMFNGALISTMSGGTIQDIEVKNSVTVTSSNNGGNIGGLVGNMTGGTISATAADKFKVQTTIEQNAASCIIGGLVGLMDDGTITGTNISNTVKLKANNSISSFGGVVGSMIKGTITGFTNNSSIEQSGDNVTITNLGGIAGSMSGGTIEGCINDVAIDAGDKYSITNVGGIVGSMTGGTINGATNNGIIGRSHGDKITKAGGIVGHINDTKATKDATITGTVVNKADVTASATGGIAGGIVGYVQNVSVASYDGRNVYQSDGITGNNGCIEFTTLDGGVPKDNAEHEYTSGSHTLKITRKANSTVDTAKLNNVTIDNSLVVFDDANNKVYVATHPTITGKLYAGGIVGQLDAGTIRNVINYGAVKNSEYVAGNAAGGVVGYMTGGQLSDIQATKESITNNGAVGDDKTQYAGGIVGYVNGADSAIMGAVTNKGNVTATSEDAAHKPIGIAGGIVGYIQNASVAMYNDETNAYISGGITGNNGVSGAASQPTIAANKYVGGIVGQLDAGEVRKSKNFGTLQLSNGSTGDMGGIVGYMTGGTLTSVDNNSAVDASVDYSITNAGGIVGKMEGGTINGATNNGVVGGTYGNKVTKAGGIVGYINDTKATKDATITGTVVNKDSVTATATDGTAGGIVGHAESASVLKYENRVYVGGGIKGNNGCIEFTTLDGGVPKDNTEHEYTSGSHTLKITRKADSTVDTAKLNNVTIDNSLVVFDDANNKVYVVTHLTITGKLYAGGIVGKLKYGGIKDSKNYGSVELSDPQGDSAIGGVVGYMSGANLVGCSNNTAITANATYVGGIAGIVNNSGITITGENTQAITSTKDNSYVGGIVGELVSGNIGESGKQVINSGAVTASGTNSYAGGIVGYINDPTMSGTNHNPRASITNSVTNKADVMASADGSIAGGIVGYAQSVSVYNTETMTGGIKGNNGDSSTHPTITGKKYSGGIVGQLDVGEVKDSNNYGLVVNSEYVAGNAAGGIVGYMTGGKISGNTTNNNPVGNTNTQYAGGIVGYINDTKVTKDATITGTVVNNASVTATATDGIAGGIVGYAQNAKEIKGNNGDSSTHPTITGNKYSGGIVGQLDVGEVKDSKNYGTVTNYEYVAGNAAGGIVGYMTGGKIFGTGTTTDDKINNNNTVGNTNTQYAGGIVGYINDTKATKDATITGTVVNNASVTATATDGIVGGIVGYAQNAKEIKGNNGDSSTHPTITGKKYSGGIVGQLDAGTITASQNFGPVTNSATVTDNAAGGIVGYMKGGSINSTNSSPVINISTGAVGGSNTYFAGGLVGILGTEGNTSTASLSGKNYANVTATATGGTAGGAVGTLREGGTIAGVTVYSGSNDANKDLAINSDSAAGGVVGNWNGGNITNATVNYVTLTVGSEDNPAGLIVGKVSGNVIISSADVYEIKGACSFNTAKKIGAFAGIVESGKTLTVNKGLEVGNEVTVKQSGCHCGLIGCNEGTVSINTNNLTFSYDFKGSVNNFGLIAGINNGIITSTTTGGAKINFENNIPSKDEIPVSTNCGGVVGTNNSGATIRNINLDGNGKTISGTTTVGGIAGINDGTIINCTVNYVTISGPAAGGIAGTNSGTIGVSGGSTQCKVGVTNNQNVTIGVSDSLPTNAGGIAGTSSGNIYSPQVGASGVTVTITASSNAGGIVGDMTGGTTSGGQVGASGATVTISALSNAGGIVGSMSNGTISNFIVTEAKVNNTHAYTESATNSIRPTAYASAGGIVGYMHGGNIEGSETVSGCNISAGSGSDNGSWLKNVVYVAGTIVGRYSINSYDSQNRPNNIDYTSLNVNNGNSVSVVIDTFVQTRSATRVSEWNSGKKNYYKGTVTLSVVRTMKREYKDLTVGGYNTYCGMCKNEEYASRTYSYDYLLRCGYSNDNKTGSFLSFSIVKDSIYITVESFKTDYSLDKEAGTPAGKSSLSFSSFWPTDAYSPRFTYTDT